MMLIWWARQKQQMGQIASLGDGCEIGLKDYIKLVLQAY